MKEVTAMAVKLAPDYDKLYNAAKSNLVKKGLTDRQASLHIKKQLQGVQGVRKGRKKVNEGLTNLAAQFKGISYKPVGF